MIVSFQVATNVWNIRTTAGPFYIDFIKEIYLLLKKNDI